MQRGVMGVKLAFLDLSQSDVPEEVHDRTRIALLAKLAVCSYPIVSDG